jgi:hypothetical protein
MLKWVHMEIKNLGKQTILLKGKKENVLINPDLKTLDDGKIQSRIIAFTSEKFDSMKLDYDKVILRGPGEYEVGGVEMIGLNGGKGETIYTFNLDGVVICILGESIEPLSDKKIERINNVDVLITSVKIRKEIDNKMILDWAKKWGVNYLIPMDYNEEDLKKFLDDVDMEGLEAADSLKMEKDNLPDGMETIVLKQND